MVTNILTCYISVTVPDRPVVTVIQLFHFAPRPVTCIDCEGHKWSLLGPLCYKLITVVNCYLETGLTCFVYCPKALYLFIFILWLPL